MSETTKATKVSTVTDAAAWAAKGSAFQAWRLERPSLVTTALDFGGQVVGDREIVWAVAIKGLPYLQFKGGLALDASGVERLRGWLDAVFPRP